MSRSARSTFLIGLLVTLLVALLPADVRLTSQAAQEPQRQPVFRGGANYVNVDAYPRRDGRLVEGLTAGDFQVFEDGKPQKIENFEFIRIEPNTPDAARRDPNSVQEAEQLLRDPRRRVFVLFLDEYHISREAAYFVRSPLVEFLERAIGSSDLFALMTPEVSVRDLTFGQRLEVIETALADFWRRMQLDGPDSLTLKPRTIQEQFLYDCYINRTKSLGQNEAFIRKLIELARLDLVFASLEQLSVNLAGLRDERTNVILFSHGWMLERRADSGSMAWGKDGALPPIGVTRGGRITTSPTQPYAADRTKCDAEYLRLTAIDFQRRFNTFVEDARRGNVSITTVDPGGLATIIPTAYASKDPASGAARRSVEATLADYKKLADRLDTLRILSANTDGVAVVDTNDLHTPLRRLADNLASYYLLGYYSTNMNHDGRYRRIEVKVARPDVRIAARPGYRALTPELARALDSAPAPRVGTTPVEDALSALGRLRSSAELYTYGAAWPGRLAVAVELAGGQAAQARWAAGADVQVSVSDLAGDVIGSARGRIEPPARGVLLHVPTDPSSAGPWRAIVRVGRGADILDDRLEIGAVADGALGAPLLFRALPSALSPLRPAANLQFFRSERLHVEWPVRAALESKAASVLGRNGQPLALSIAVVDREIDGQGVLAVDLNLASLAAGDYVLELTAAAAARTDRSLVAFRVTR
jgi:VWFA-related protein